jgi:hypothetical protein
VRYRTRSIDLRSYHDGDARLWSAGLVKSHAALVVVALVLAGGCRTEGLSRSDIAESIGNAVAERLAGPVEIAAVTNPAESFDMLNEALVEALTDLSWPEGVSRVIPGDSSVAVMEGLASFSVAFVVVPHDDSRFCMVLAVASDGRVVTGFDPGDPRDNCRDTELIDLALTN